MSLLFDRWPRLRSLPKIALADVPTPLEPMPRLSESLGTEIWVKRDDRTGTRYGGNKVRKLEHLLGQAREVGADALITIGAVGSHHVLATAIYGRQQGFEVHALMTGQPRSEHAADNARADLLAGAHLHPVRAYALVPAALAALAAKLRLSGKRVFVIPIGGSDATGTLGYVEAGLELAQQLVTQLPGADPSAIYVPLGSGATVAGLAVGLAAAGVMIPIIGVRVTPRGIVGRPLLAALAHQAVNDLHARAERFPKIAHLAMENVTIDEDELGDGYGLPTPRAAEAMRLTAACSPLSLDVTYTGKTVAALIRAARGARKGQRLLYVHTLSSAPMAPLLEGAKALPDNVARLLK